MPTLKQIIKHNKTMKELGLDFHGNILPNHKPEKLNKSDDISSMDLNESERKLDDALANETTESLNEWLNEKRQ